MAGFNDFIQTELPKRPFTNEDGVPGQLLARSTNLLAPREAIWIDPTPAVNSLVPKKKIWEVLTDYQATFELTSLPVGDLALVSLNGLLQHDYTLDGLNVILDPPAEKNDSVMIVWFN